jgi:TP901 family phage tail tape measure protein
MATIAQLIVEVGADTASLRQGLDRSVGYLKEFARKSGRVAVASEIFGGFSRKDPFGPERKGAAVALEELRKDFAKTQTRIREDFARNLINKEQFLAKGKEAAQKFNQGILTELDTLKGKSGPAFDRLRAGWVSQFKDIGDRAGAAMKANLLKQATSQVELGQNLTRNVSLPIAAALTGAGIVASDFEFKMLKVGATLDATQKDFEKLEDAARDQTNVIEFGNNAVQSAEALQILAQAGYDVEQAIGILPTALKLATVEQVDLTTATNIATGAIAAFKFEAQDAGFVADVLAKASIDSKATLTDLGTSMTYVGGVANNLGLNFIETTAALEALAEQNFRGTLAGTALRGILTKLASPTKKQASVLKELGIQTKDAEGRLLSFSKIVKQFEDASVKFGKYRTAAKELELFAQRAGPGFAAIIAVGSENLKKWENDLASSAGTLESINKKQISGATGAFLKLKASIIELAISIGESGLLDAIRAVANAFSTFVKFVSKLPEPLKQILLALTVIAAAAGPVITAFGLLGLASLTLGAGMVALGISLGTVASFFLGGAALFAGIVALIALFKDQKKETESLDEATKRYQNTLKGLDGEQLRYEATLQQTYLNNVTRDRERLTASLKSLETERDRLKVIERANRTLAIGSEKDLVGQKAAADLRKNAEAIKATKAAIDAASKAQDTFRARTFAATTQWAQYNRIRALFNPNLPDGNEPDLAPSNKKLDRLKQEQTALEAILAFTKEAIEKFNTLQSTGVIDIGLRLQGQVAIEEQLKTLKGLLEGQLTLALTLELTGTGPGSALGTANEIQRVIAEVQKALDEAAKKKINLNFDKSFAVIDVPTVNLQVEQIRKIGDEYKAVYDKLKFATAAGDKVGIELANAQLKAVEEQVKALVGVINARLLLNKTLTEAEKLALQREIIQVLEDAGIKTDEVKEKAAGWLGVLASVRVALRGIRNAGRGLEVISETVDNAISSIETMLLAVKQLNKAFDTANNGLGKIDYAAAASSLIGAIGAAVGFFSSILNGGESETDKLIRENNERLAELRDGLDRFQVNLGSTADAVKAIANLEQNGFDTAIGNRLFKLDVEKNRASLDAVLAPFDLTISKLNKIAEEYGITLIKDGKIQGKAFEQLKEAAELAALELSKFSSDLQGIVTLQEVRNKLQGIPDTAEQQVKDQLAILAQVAPDLYAALNIPAFETITPEAAAAIKASLLNLVNLIDAGLIDYSDFGDFASADEFLQYVGKMADSLGTLTDATDAAVASLLNVPTGYKIERARFAAQIAKDIETIGDGIIVRPPVTTVDDTAGGRGVFDGLDKLEDIFRKIYEQNVAGAPAQQAALLDTIATSTPTDLLDQLTRVQSAFTLGLQDSTSAIVSALQGLISGGTDSSGLTGAGGGGNLVLNVTVNGDSANAKQTGTQIADVVLSTLRRKSVTRFGTSSKWGTL